MKKSVLHFLRRNYVEAFLVLIVLTIGGIMIFSSYKATQYHYVLSEESKQYDSYFRETSKGILEELAHIKEKNIQDSILESVVASQIMILKRQDDLVNDIRQETNNNIEKAHALLSFWVGILALLGVFVPLILQFKMHHYAKKDIEDLKRELISEINVLMNEVRGEKRALGIVMADMGKLRDDLEPQRYLNDISSIRVNAEQGFLPELGESRGIFRRMWEQSMDNFSHLIDSFFEQRCDCEQTRIQLIGCLIHTSAALIEVTRDSSRRRHRAVRRGIERLRETIRMVVYHNYPNWRVLHDELEALLQELRSMNFDDSDRR